MPRDLELVYRQVRYQNKIFWRTPVSAFFTIVLPLMFLVLFTAIFGNDEIESLGVTTAQFYAPALAVFAAASATYSNLSITTAIARDEGILKKVRGTPLPPWAYIAGRVGSAVWIAVIAVIVMMMVGSVAYGVEIIGSTIVAVRPTAATGPNSTTWLPISTPMAARSTRHTPPQATRAAVSRALARSRISRASSRSYFRIPTRSA